MEIKRHEWSDALIKTHLLNVMGDDVNEFRESVLNGNSKIWHFIDHSVDLWMVTRRDSFIKGDELVICCVNGRGLKKVMTEVEASARRTGCKSIRFHTRMKGLFRMFPDYEMFQIVGRKVL